MSYYDWNKIVQSYSDSELKKVYREQDREQADKVSAVIEELVKRGLLDSDKAELITPDNKAYIKDSAYVRGKTESNKNNANNVVWAIAVVLAMYAVSIFSSYMQYDLLTSVKAGEFISSQQANSNDQREVVVTVIYFLSFIISAILFIVWFHKAYSNLNKRVRKTEHSVGWSIGAWFVPIVSLFRPFNIMVEIDKNADKILEKRGVVIENKQYSFISLWWGLFIGTHVLGRILTRLTLDSTTVDDYILSTFGDIVLSFLGIILGVVTILMIRNYAEKEEFLFKSEMESFQHEIIQMEDNTL